jgi:DNA-directed RNA polymerase sigma subunit (sigma70/sigma32)
MHLSRERVRQIEERAKQKLRLIARARQLKEFLN